MLNTQHFGYEPIGTYQDAPLCHRRRYKEVKLSILATFIIKKCFIQLKLAILMCELYKRKQFLILVIT